MEHLEKFPSNFNHLYDIGVLTNREDTFLEKYFNSLQGNEFSTKYKEGYGHLYANSIQEVPYAKNIGIFSILNMFAYDKDSLILDVFGGSGQINKALNNFLSGNGIPQIITADIELDQISNALNNGFLSCPLNASDMRIINDNCFDSVLLSYGFHHVAPNNRFSAISEAMRVLKVGGKLFLHEGLQGGVTQRLSSGLVDALGTKPHDYPFPSHSENIGYFEKLKIKTFSFNDVFDPHVFFSSSKESVITRFCKYIIQHYSLEGITQDELLIFYRTIIRGHKFNFETEFLVGNHWWTQGKDYAFNFYTGASDPDLIKAVFPLKAPENLLPEKASHCVVVPRFARVYEAIKSN